MQGNVGMLMTSDRSLGNHFTCLVKLPVLAKGNYFMVAQIAKPWVAVIDKMDAYLPFEGIASAWRREKDHSSKSRVTAVWNLARN